MSTKDQTILVPVDFTESTKYAVEQAVVLAKYLKLEIILLHVIEKSKFGIFTKRHTIQKYESDCMLQLNTIADNIRQQENSVVVKVMLEKDKLHKRIAKTATLFYSKSIILGFDPANDENTLRPKIVDFIKSLKNNECRVYTVKKNKFEKLKNIILPLDISKESRQKVPIAFELAKIHQAKIHLTSVFTSGEAIDLKKLKIQQNQIEELFTKNKIECVSKIINKTGEDKSFGDMVLEYSDEVNGDLIVVMTNKEIPGGFDPISLICRSNTPVLSIISKKIGAAGGFN